jgi:YesN/AraC family two-component response regulator
MSKFNISGKTYHAKPNSLVLVSAFESHSREIIQYPYNRYVLAINNEFSAKFLNHPLLLSVLLRRPENFCHQIDLDKQTTESIAEICQEMIHETEQKGAFWEENVASMIMQMLITVYRFSSEAFWPDDSSNASKLVYKIQKHIGANYMKDLSLEELSKEFFVSKYYLSRIFKSATGFNYKDYLIQCRLSVAKDLLVNSRLSINEICEECGYNNINHFIRIFKTYEGIPPAKYRKATAKMNA